MKKEKRGRRSPCEPLIFEASAFDIGDWTKDFGGTRFKGYTIVVRDVNRRQLVDFGQQKNGGTSSNVVISRFKVSSPT
jgi:hypothetical protein